MYVASAQVLDELEGKLKASKAEYEAMLSTDVAAFNKLMGEKSAPLVR